MKDTLNVRRMTSDVNVLPQTVSSHSVSILGPGLSFRLTGRGRQMKDREPEAVGWGKGLHQVLILFQWGQKGGKKLKNKVEGVLIKLMHSAKIFCV